MSLSNYSRTLSTACGLGISLCLLSSRAHANITVYDKDDWKFSLGGFVETDTIVDSTRSFREIIGNGPVQPGSGVNGVEGRTQFSIRNSRLAFTLDAPSMSGWATKGYLEFDLLGFDPQNTAANGTYTTANNSESGFFDNPTLRLRHGFIQTEKDGFQVLAGQYWNLLGWQPYYFMSTVDVAPLPATLYARNAQVRALKAINFTDQDVLQVAAAIVRPPQEDSRYPSLEAGARFAMGERSSGFTGSATGGRKTQPMSVAISGTAREYAIPNPSNPTVDTVHYTGYGLAADAMIPVIASSDGKQVENTLSLLGEFTIGSGDGDQFNSFSGGTASPLNASKNAPSSALNLDSGIGDYDPNQTFRLIHVRTFNVHAQYHLPESFLATWIDAGYGQLFSNNAGMLATATGADSGSTNLVYNRESVIFANVFHDFAPWLRTGFEFAHVETDYVSGIRPINNRYQLSAWFLF